MEHGDLADALARDGSAKTFDGFPPSSKRVILEWIAAAKTDATRTKRIDDTARKAARGEWANHYQQ